MMIQVPKLADGREVLAGRALGRKALGQLISREVSTSVPTLQFLDFRSCALVTGSFLAEFLLGYSKSVRARSSNIYPVTVMIDDVSLQELELLANNTGEVFPICSDVTSGRMKAFRYVGPLDSAHAETIERVEHLGVASAKYLAESSTANTRIGVTGWHNRLAALSRKGLLIEETSGRQKIYRSLAHGA